MFLVAVAATAGAGYALLTVEVDRNMSQAGVAERAGPRTQLRLARCPVARGDRVLVSTPSESFTAPVARVVDERGLTVEVARRGTRRQAYPVQVSVARDRVTLARLVLDSVGVRPDDDCR